MAEFISALFAQLKKILNNKYIIICILVFAAGAGLYWYGYNKGYTAGYKKAQQDAITPKAEQPEIKTDLQTNTRTQYVYIPKETVIYKDQTTGAEKTAQEKTDLEVNQAKQELHIKVNGQEQTITKAANEAFIFDKNKLQITQESSASVSIKVPEIDKTKHWGLGIGAASRRPAYILTGPIGKKVDGWIYKDSEKTAGGVMLRF